MLDQLRIIIRPKGEMFLVGPMWEVPHEWAKGAHLARSGKHPDDKNYTYLVVGSTGVPQSKFTSTNSTLLLAVHPSTLVLSKKTERLVVTSDTSHPESRVQFDVLFEHWH